MSVDKNNSKAGDKAMAGNLLKVLDIHMPIACGTHEHDSDALEGNGLDVKHVKDNCENATHMMHTNPVKNGSDMMEVMGRVTLNSNTTPLSVNFLIHNMPACPAKKVKPDMKMHETILLLSIVHKKLTELSDLVVLVVCTTSTVAMTAGGTVPSVPTVRVVTGGCCDETGTVTTIGAIKGCPGR